MSLGVETLIIDRHLKVCYLNLTKIIFFFLQIPFRMVWWLKRGRKRGGQGWQPRQRCGNLLRLRLRSTPALIPYVQYIMSKLTKPLYCVTTFFWQDKRDNKYVVGTLCPSARKGRLYCCARALPIWLASHSVKSTDLPNAQEHTLHYILWHLERFYCTVKHGKLK